MKSNKHNYLREVQSLLISSFRCIVMMFVLLINLQAQEDEIQFTHLTAEDGLSLSAVTQILQDSKGFLWFGTYNGLNRYDGYNFKIFLPETTNPKSISNHSIWSLCEDSKGFIWIATLDGLNRYDRKTEEFRSYKNNPNDPNSLSNGNVLSIFEDSKGTVWVGTIDGLNKYNRDKDNFTVIMNVNNNLSADELNSVTCIEEDYKGNLWLGTWNGLTCMQKDGKIIKQYYAEKSNSTTFDYRKISCLFEDDSKNLWIGLNGKGLDKYNPRTGKFTHYESGSSDITTLSNNYITLIYQDKSNDIWIGTRDGLNKFNHEKNNFKRILHNPEKPSSIITNEILSIRQDNTGIIWVGTTAGLSRFYQPLNKFNFYKENKNKLEKNLISNRIHSAHSNSKDKLWVGTFDGLDEIDLASGDVKHYQHEPGNNNSLTDNFIMSVLEDRKGIVWAGTNFKGLNRYNPATGEFRSYKFDINNPTSISNDGVISLCEDRSGTLWAGTWWGLNRFDEKTGTFLRYHTDPSKPNSLSHELIWIVYEDSKGMLWLGTDGGGACEFNPIKNTFTNFSQSISGPHHISGNRVITIIESHDSIIWLGTTDGLNSYDRKTGKTITYTTRNGLPGNLINGMLEDNKGRIWISTDQGLSKFDRNAGTFTNYTKRNGLKELEFNQNVSFKSKNGLLYFACKSGLMFFNPDSIKDKYFTAPVVFTDLKIFNQPVPIIKDENSILTKSITESKSINIPYRNSVITIDFALLDFFNVKRNMFSYKLVGFDEEWNEVGSRNSATYTNLPPGEYTFIVKAFNSDGVRDAEEASLGITIIPAFYQTWWFKIMVGLSLVLATFLTFHIRTQKIKRQNKILENRVIERTRDLDKTIFELSQEVVERKKAEEKVQASLKEKELLLKETHHRVKNNLQVISSILFLQSRSIKDEKILNLFEDSQNRIRSMALIHEKLYQSNDAAEVNFKEYVRGLVEHLNRSYYKNGPIIKTNVYIEDIKLSLDTAISCGLIVNELMTNSYKYAFPVDWAEQKSKTEELLIEVKVEKHKKNGFILTVSDNGIGLPKNFNPQDTDSLGLKLVSSIVSQLNGSIEFVGTNGTQVKIVFKDNNKI